MVFWRRFRWFRRISKVWWDSLGSRLPDAGANLLVGFVSWMKNGCEKTKCKLQVWNSKLMLMSFGFNQLTKWCICSSTICIKFLLTVFWYDSYFQLKRWATISKYIHGINAAIMSVSHCFQAEWQTIYQYCSIMEWTRLMRHMKYVVWFIWLIRPQLCNNLLISNDYHHNLGRYAQKPKIEGSLRDNFLWPHIQA